MGSRSPMQCRLGTSIFCASDPACKLMRGMAPLKNRAKRPSPSSVCACQPYRQACVLRSRQWPCAAAWLYAFESELAMPSQITAQVSSLDSSALDGAVWGSIRQLPLAIGSNSIASISQIGLAAASALHLGRERQSSAQQEGSCYGSLCMPHIQLQHGIRLTGRVQ